MGCFRLFQVHHDFFQVGLAAIEGKPLRVLPLEQGGAAVLCAARAQNIKRGGFGHAARVGRQPVRADEIVQGAVGGEPSLLQEQDAVGALVQVGSDVGGKQDGFPLVLEGKEDFDQFLPAHRVQAAGGFVQQHQFRAVGQSQGQCVLDLHAVGQGSGGFAFVQAKAAHVLLVRSIVPAGIEGAGHVGDGFQLFPGIVGHARRHEADLLLDFRRVLTHGKTGEQHLAPVGLDEGQDGVQRGGFPRAVAPDEAGDGPGREIEGYVIQRESRVFLAQAPYGQGRVIFRHCESPPRFSKRIGRPPGPGPDPRPPAPSTGRRGRFGTPAEPAPGSRFGPCRPR